MLIVRPRTGSTRYMAMLGLVPWLVVSVWSFAADGYADYLLAVVSAFFFIVVAMLFTLSHVWRKSRDAEADQGQHESLRDWASGEFETWQGPVKGTEAAVETLLPLAAVAFGMTAFGIVLSLTSHGMV